MLDDRQMSMLKINVSKNLDELRKAMEWNQAKFADKTGISEPTLTYYLKGDKKDGRLPPIDYLVKLCTMQEFKDKGLELTLDLLISEKFNPRVLIQKRYNQSAASRQEVKHGDFLGNYLCSFLSCFCESMVCF